MAAVAERVYDAYSKRDENDQEHLGTCSLVVGDGTSRIDFVKGRAKVPAHLVEIAANHPQIDVPGYRSTIEDATAAEEADNELAELEARVAELRARRTRVLAAAPALEVTQAVEVAPDEVAEKSRLELARAYLEAEGIEVPDVDAAAVEAAKATPSERTENPADQRVSKAASNRELEPRTQDDQPRCQALKTNHQQCQNAAVNDSKACGLPKHQAQHADD